MRLLPAAWSIRLRLTAWYTLVLTLILLAVVISLRTLFERRLRSDLDARLLATAWDIERQVTVHPNYPDLAQVEVPNLDPFTFPGLLTQVVDLQGTVIDGSGGLDGYVLPTAPLAASDREPAFRTSEMADVDLRTVRLPIVVRQGDEVHAVGAILVGESYLPLDRTISRLQQLLLLATAVGAGLAAVGGWLLAGHALRPVDRITVAAAAIAAKADSVAALTARLPVPASRDEIARLAITFNVLLDRLETAFATQRRFVADASHELRTPLTAVRSNVDVLLQQSVHGDPCLDRQEVLTGLRGVQRGAARMGRLLDDLLQLARTDAGVVDHRPPRAVRLDLVADDAVNTAAAVASGQVVELCADQPVVVMGDADRLYQLLLALLENAVRHTPPGGRVTVDVVPAGSQARLKVRDTGTGIAPEHLPHIFERFYRADGGRARAAGGAGLGLAIARAIVQEHHGEIRVASTPGEGSVFTVTLPLVAVVTARADTAAARR
jgi:signal transduction histidine kinase